MNHSAENQCQKIPSAGEKGSIITQECLSEIIHANNPGGSKKSFAHYSQKQDEYKEVM